MFRTPSCCVLSTSKNYVVRTHVKKKYTINFYARITCDWYSPRLVRTDNFLRISLNSQAQFNFTLVLLIIANDQYRSENYISTYKRKVHTYTYVIRTNNFWKNSLNSYAQTDFTLVLLLIANVSRISENHHFFCQNCQKTQKPSLQACFF